MGERDPREILGLPNGASEDDLKDAYRRLALRHHPDRNRGDEIAAAKFREVSEAYAALRRDGRCPGASREGMATGASHGFAFAADANFDFAFSSRRNTVSCPKWQIDPPGAGTAAGPATPDHSRGNDGRATRRSAGLSAKLCLVFGGVLIGVALPKAAPVVGTYGSARLAPLASSPSALAPAADATDFTTAEDAPGRLYMAPAGDAPSGVAVLPAVGAPLARFEAPVADVSSDHAAAMRKSAAAERALARPVEPACGQNAAWAEGGLTGQDATSAERPYGVAFARPAPPPTLAGIGTPTAGDRAVPPLATAKASALFAILMRAGERAMQLSDFVGARSHYERAAALDPTSSTAAIAAGETYDPHVLSLAGVTHPWLTDTAKAAAWYERARPLGDPAAAGLLTRLHRPPDPSPPMAEGRRRADARAPTHGVAPRAPREVPAMPPTRVLRVRQPDGRQLTSPDEAGPASSRPDDPS